LYERHGKTNLVFGSADIATSAPINVDQFMPIGMGLNLSFLSHEEGQDCMAVATF
jgi:hypothetical protein